LKGVIKKPTNAYAAHHNEIFLKFFYFLLLETAAKGLKS
jgi:hypothetical protein